MRALTQGAELDNSRSVKSSRWNSSSLSRTRARNASPRTCAALASSYQVSTDLHDC